MIPLSTAYKLVVNGVIVAEGSKARMKSLKRKTPNSKIYLTSGRVGEALSVGDFIESPTLETEGVSK